jgi:hypothetical protein
MPEILDPFSPELITDDITVQAMTSKLQAVLTDEIALPSRDACRDYATTHFNWFDISQKVRKILLT